MPTQITFHEGYALVGDQSLPYLAPASNREIATAIPYASTAVAQRKEVVTIVSEEDVVVRLGANDLAGHFVKSCSVMTFAITEGDKVFLEPTTYVPAPAGLSHGSPLSLTKVTSAPGTTTFDIGPMPLSLTGSGASIQVLIDAHKTVLFECAVGGTVDRTALNPSGSGVETISAAISADGKQLVLTSDNPDREFSSVWAVAK